ncbi:MAG: hypothetical protein AB7O56_00595 [Bauldia sp.]
MLLNALMPDERLSLKRLARSSGAIELSLDHEALFLEMGFLERTPGGGLRLTEAGKQAARRVSISHGEPQAAPAPRPAAPPKGLRGRLRKALG